MRATHLFLIYIVLSVISPSVLAQRANQGMPQLNLPHTTLTVGMHRIDAQVATTPTQHQIGLMYRQSLPDYEGMLFVFPSARVQCFWMRNTSIPLTAAFVADDGTIVNLADMKPMDESNHCSVQPVRFVLEVNRGWFAKRHLYAGAKLHNELFQPLSALTSTSK